MDFFMYQSNKLIQRKIVRCCREYFSQSEEIKDILDHGIGYDPGGRKKNNGEIESKESLSYRPGDVESKSDDVYDSYIKDISAYAKKIFNLILESLNVNPKDYHHTINPSFDTLSLIHYPDNSNKCGVKDCDWGYLTLLLTMTEGLQVKLGDKWIDVPVI